MNEKEIVAYYNDCKKDYSLLWRLDKVWGMHYGYFEKKDRSLRGAILKMNEQILKHVPISSESRVLDAGCGYCGTAIYIAEKKRCQIDAITIVEEQVKTAQRVIEAKKLNSYIHVSLQSYMETQFDGETFDVIYGIECVCYADKVRFLKEAHRLLKPGGTLIILDGFNAKEKELYTEKEQRIMEYWNRGWAVDSLESGEYFIRESKSLGMIQQQFIDITPHVKKTSKIMYMSSYPAYVVDFIGRMIHKRSKYNTGNVRAARYQYIGLKKELWQYGIFIAKKESK